MKLSILLITCIVAVDALIPLLSTRTKITRPSFGLFAASDNADENTPFFLNDGEKKTPTPPKTPPPSKAMEPRPTISLTQLVNDETRENLEKVGDALKKELVDPLLSGELEKGVPKDAIKGAALTGVSLSLLAGQGLAITGAAGLGAAYVALSSGMGGKAVRSVGSAAWESAVAAAELYEKYGMTEKITKMTTRVVTQTIDALQQQGIRERLAAEEAARKVEEEERMAQEEKQEEQRLADLIEAQTKQKEQEARDEAIRIKQEAADKKKKEDEEKRQDEIAAVEQKQMEEAEAARKKEEAEAKRQADIAAAEQKQKEEAEAARKKEEAETKRLADIAAAEQKQKEEAEAARKKEEEEEAKRQAEIAAAAEQKQQEEAERQAKLAEEYRIAAEKKQAKAAKEEQEAEKQRLAEKMRLEDEARIEEAARKRQEAQQEEEARLKGDFAVEEDDDLETTIRLAEQILDGTIAGLDDAIASDEFKEEWDSAGRLAQDLEGKGASAQQEDEDDVDALSDEEDMEMLAQAAREAVTKFEEEMKNQDATKAKQKDLWDSEMVTEDDFDYDEGVEELREEYDDEEDEDMEQLQGDLDEDFGNVDMEALGRQAREAVEQFQAEGDNVGTAARESVAKFNAKEADTDDHASITDWSKFTVAQLRDELRSRDLKATGKKAELVARLTENDFDSQVQEEETGEGVMWDSELVEEPTMEDLMATQEEEPSLEDLAQAAREAVELFEQQELEDDEEEEDDVAASSALEYETMTVNELKDELRNRGLKVSGKKADLIERLRSS